MLWRRHRDVIEAKVALIKARKQTQIHFQLFAQRVRFDRRCLPRGGCSGSPPLVMIVTSLPSTLMVTVTFFAWARSLHAASAVLLAELPLSSAAAADPVLADRDGNPFLLSSLHGRKVLLVAWASW